MGIVPQAVARFFSLQFGIHCRFVPATAGRCVCPGKHSGCPFIIIDTGSLDAGMCAAAECLQATVEIIQCLEARESNGKGAQQEGVYALDLISFHE